MTNSIVSFTVNSYSPYRTPITEVLQLLEDARIINPDNKQRAINLALDYLNDNSDIISIVWSVDDVLSVANDRNIKLSQEQCLEVLSCLEHNHDANYGINWESIHCAIDSLHFS